MEHSTEIRKAKDDLKELVRLVGQAIIDAEGIIDAHIAVDAGIDRLIELVSGETKKESLGLDVINAPSDLQIAIYQYHKLNPSSQPASR